MKIKNKNNIIEIETKTVSFFGKFSGLMFRSKDTQNLLFNFKKQTPAIHSLFVFFPFLAVWLNERNEVIETKIVKPFTFHVSPKNIPTKLLEVPFNKKNKQILRLLVDKSKHLNIS